MTSTDAPRVPDGLGPAGRSFWRRVTARYELSLGELALLARVAKTMDVIARIDKELAVSPLLVPGSTGQWRANPLLEAKVSQERVLELLVRGLALPLPSAGEKTGRRRTPSQVIKVKEAANGPGDRARAADTGGAVPLRGGRVGRPGPAG